MVIYDTIGQDYNETRKADPYIADRLHSLLQPRSNGVYLDIGCGTGNYLNALTAMGLNCYGIDPSQTMLRQARLKNENAMLIKASAENIPLANESIDGAIGTFTIHHWNDIYQGLRELFRVLKPSARFVTLSFTPKQMSGYWLCHYFPKMIERSMATIPDMVTMEQLFIDVGFKSVSYEKYFVTDSLQDHFLYSNKYRPEQYLLQEVRNNISSFKMFADNEELETGLSKLESDISTNTIKSIIDSYQNDMGDYLFYIAHK